MSTVITPTVKTGHKVLTRRQSIALVFCCTLIGAFAQVLIKLGANSLNQATLGGKLLGMATSWSIVSGYTLYALFTLLFIFALRDEELSLLYPIISLNYVWVALLSVLFFGERWTAMKGVGIAVIVSGVGVLGRDKPK